MPSLDDLKKRIASVKSTQKITKAMKMVAAAKLRKAQEAAEQSRPYSDNMKNLMDSIFRGFVPTDLFLLMYLLPTPTSSLTFTSPTPS